MIDMKRKKVNVHRMEILAFSLLVILIASFLVVQPFNRDLLVSTKFENESSLVLKDDVSNKPVEEIGSAGETNLLSGTTGALVIDTEDVEQEVLSAPVKIGSISVEAGMTITTGSIGK